MADEGKTASKAPADVPLNTSVPPETICQSTPHPSVCTSVLPHKNANVYDFGRFSVQYSFVQSQKLLDLINKYLQGGSGLSQLEIQALEDCKSLALLNIDFLSNALETVNKTSDVLPSSDADDVQTLLSAILTNQQTCFDGLQSVSSVQNDLSVSVSNGTNFYSISLALVTKGWVPKGHKNNGTPNQSTRHLSFRKGRLSLKMSSKARAVYDSVINRRRHLLQAGDEEVVVKDIVVVSQDGTGNFTTINDDINAAPNNSVASDGYFLVYITAGVYEEYVSIISKKKYLLLIGDGINQTIITGSNSVGGGSTTFNSATLAVVATGFIAVNITVRNTAGPSMGQAVAVRNGAYLEAMEAWKEYSRTVYLQNFMDSLIDPAGWLAWSGDFALSTLYYAEYDNRGPGADTSNRVTWPGYHIIGAADASNFTVSNFVLGDSWLPQTGVPYTGGLM
ncbi:hypothetical protein ACLB2K_053451 [Fragaria x ananassa]